MKQWRYGVITLLREAFKKGELKLPLHLGNADPTPDDFNPFLSQQYEKPWIVHFAKATKTPLNTIKYLGRYIKRPPLSMSRLHHYDGKTVVFNYLDHKTKSYRQMSCEAEEFIETLTQHIISHDPLLRLPGQPGSQYSTPDRLQPAQSAQTQCPETHLPGSSEKYLWNGYPAVPALQGPDALYRHHAGKTETGTAQTPNGVSVSETRCLIHALTPPGIRVCRETQEETGILQRFQLINQEEHSGTVQK